MKHICLQIPAENINFSCTEISISSSTKKVKETSGSNTSLRNSLIKQALKDVFDDTPQIKSNSLLKTWKSLSRFDFDKYGTAGLISSSINEGHLIMNLQWDGGEYSGMVNSQGVP